TDQQVIDALRPLAGPDAPVGMVELGMVSEVRVRRHRVAVTLAHPDGPAAVGAELRRRIGDAVLALPGVRDVSVSATVMAPDRAGAYRAKVAAAAAPRPAPPGPAPRRPDQARVNPFGPRSTTRVVGITSGKGGVGKSSVTVNLAVSLARAGFRTAVLDADVYGFSVPRMLGVTGDPAVRDGKMVPPVAHGVSCMSMGFFVDDDQPVIWRGPMLHKALEQFLVDVDWAEPDFLLVDMPPGTGDVALSMAQYLPASEIYVVTTPQAAAKRVAQRSAAMARKVNLPMRGVIENMSWFTADDGTRYELFGSGGGQELADELGVALLGRVPLVPALREGGDAGRPVTVTSPDGEASRAIAGIAAAVASMGRARIFHPELTIA
ncbi:MAG: Mrp/NBP35 family ATP-binding protein, partial [Acidimicrobiales bacterium]